METIDDLERKFDQASKYISIEQLGIAPQCGFSSTEEGNIISFDDQKKKLELVIKTANKMKQIDCIIIDESSMLDIYLTSS